MGQCIDVRYSMIIGIFYFFFFFANPQIQCTDIIDALLPEDARLDFSELVTKYGHKCEEFEVTTEDGYILKLFHIKGNRNKHVLAVHGLFCSSDIFVARGNTSSALLLANAGYDVWAINNRGNKYSRKHVSLDPDKDKKFWDYSVTEFGIYDLPATIDFVLKKTEVDKITILSVSLGATETFIMGSLKPEYNDKIKLHIAMGPIAFMKNSHLLTLSQFWPLFNVLLKTTGFEEIMRYDSLLEDLLKSTCSLRVNYELCVNLIVAIGGHDKEQCEPDFMPTLFAHFPSAVSRKEVIHFLQSIAGKQFSDYDYGTAQNLVQYGNVEPPSFNISKIKAPVALLVGRNDYLATVKDVEYLNGLLPNVVRYHIMDRPKFNHFDFIFAKDLELITMPPIFDLLENQPDKSSGQI